jgi:hypothetical protein
MIGSVKVYEKNQPKNWGYKIPCDCSVVLLNFEIYTGKEHDSNVVGVGVSGNVLRMTTVLQ